MTASLIQVSLTYIEQSLEAPETFLQEGVERRRCCILDGTFGGGCYQQPRQIQLALLINSTKREFTHHSALYAQLWLMRDILG